MNTDFELAEQSSSVDVGHERHSGTETDNPLGGLRAHIIFDRGRRVIASDNDARLLASTQWSGVTMEDRVLRVTPDATADLVADTVAGLRSLPPGGIAVPLCNRSLDARLVSLTRGGASPLGPLFLLTVAQRSRVTNYVALARRLGLTLAEAGIVDALCSGMSVRDYAQRRHVETGTVRTQLKSIYRKLSVHGQVELVSHVWRAAERDA